MKHHGLGDLSTTKENKLEEKPCKLKSRMGTHLAKVQGK
jgi:hypothetical protein